MNRRHHPRCKHQAEINRFEDALDFLAILPDWIEWAAGTIHYLPEPEDVVRTKTRCYLTGAALLVQLIFERSDYRSVVVLDVPGREEIMLYVEEPKQPE